MLVLGLVVRLCLSFPGLFWVTLVLGLIAFELLVWSGSVSAWLICFVFGLMVFRCLLVFF